MYEQLVKNINHVIQKIKKGYLNVLLDLFGIGLVLEFLLGGPPLFIGQ